MIEFGERAMPAPRRRDGDDRVVMLTGTGATLVGGGEALLHIAVDAGMVVVTLPGSPGATPQGMSPLEALAFADHIRRLAEREMAIDTHIGRPPQLRKAV